MVTEDQPFNAVHSDRTPLTSQERIRGIQYFTWAEDRIPHIYRPLVAKLKDVGYHPSLLESRLNPRRLNRSSGHSGPQADRHRSRSNNRDQNRQFTHQRDRRGREEANRSSPPPVSTTASGVVPLLDIDQISVQHPFAPYNRNGVPLNQLEIEDNKRQFHDDWSEINPYYRPLIQRLRWSPFTPERYYLAISLAL